jgi:phage terminase large subunit GpA-like protein
VYAYCKKNAPRRIFAIKGVGGEGKPISGRPSKNNIGKCLLFPVGVDTAKDLLFARMRIKEAGPGYMHFANALNDEYFRQLTAEKIVTRFHRGFKKRVFEKIRPRNEALDCMVYALAAYGILGVNVNALADKLENAQDAVESSEQEQRQTSYLQRGKPRGNFATSWR